MNPKSLTLGSPQGRVPKGGNEHLACAPSFETRASRAPQDEVKFEQGLI
jgi:hypothetical protein